MTLGVLTEYLLRATDPETKARIIIPITIDTIAIFEIALRGPDLFKFKGQIANAFARRQSCQHSMRFRFFQFFGTQNKFFSLSKLGTRLGSVAIDGHWYLSGYYCMTGYGLVWGLCYLCCPALNIIQSISNVLKLWKRKRNSLPLSVLSESLSSFQSVVNSFPNYNLSSLIYSLTKLLVQVRLLPLLRSILGLSSVHL